MESMCSISSTVEEQEGESKQNPSLFFDQLLHKSSLRYRPLIMSACTEAIDILDGEEPAVVQSG